MVFSEVEYLGCGFDTKMLAMQVPELPRILRGQINADVVADRCASLLHLKRAPIADAAQWPMARDLVLRLGVSKTHTFHNIRRKLGNMENPNTSRSLSEISLWLAGELGLPVSVTKPWSVLMMEEVAQFGTWSVLKTELS